MKYETRIQNLLSDPYKIISQGNESTILLWVDNESILIHLIESLDLVDKDPLEHTIDLSYGQFAKIIEIVEKMEVKK